MGLTVKYISAAMDSSGYGAAARAYITALDKLVDLQLQMVSFETEKTTHGKFMDIVNKQRSKTAPSVQIIHLTPDNFPAYYRPGIYNIGYCTWEADRIPEKWVEYCNLMSELWVPSQWNIEVFKNSGVVKPIYCIPHIIEPPDLSVALSIPAIPDDIYLFYTIAQWCYDKETRVLTKNGFKYFKDLTYEDEIASLNKETEELEYHKPTKIVSFDRNDKMLLLENQAFNFCVTPDHRMLLRHKKDRNWKLIPANKILNKNNKFQSQWRTKKDCIWKGEEEVYFSLAQKEIPMDNFLQLLGWYISEGSCYIASNGYYIEITQKKSEANIQEIHDVILSCGFTPFRTAGGWRFASKELTLYFKKLGYSFEKYIPSNFLKLSSRQLKILFTAMMKGDGRFKGEKECSYITTSSRLAEQVLEILLKTNRSGSISICDPTEHNIYINNKYRTIHGKHQCYTISINEKRNEQSLAYATPKIIDYNDKIYCISIPNETLFIERKGKVLWSGNTARKNPVTLLKAYFTEFRPTEKVGLLLKSYRMNTSPAEQQLLKNDIILLKKSLRIEQTPPIYFFGKLEPREMIMGIHRRGDCFVLPCRAEGFGICQSAAMSLGKPTISSNYGGCLEFMTKKNSLLVDGFETPCCDMIFGHYNGYMNWFEPSVSELKKKMRWCFENREAANRMGERGRETILSSFNSDVIGKLMLERLTCTK